MDPEREIVTDWRYRGEQIKIVEKCGTHGSEEECRHFGRKVWM
jgi:hypothetical protein